MSVNKIVANSFLKDVPPIRRARGYRLYDHKGNRYLDMFQNGGAAILGHRPKGLSLALKNTIEKGLYAPYPSIYTERLQKLLRSLFPHGGDIFIFRNYERGVDLLSRAYAMNLSEYPLEDPLGGLDGKSPIRLWRPYLENQNDPAPFTVPLIPFPGMCEPVIVCVRKDICRAEGMELASDPVSPVILSGIIKVFHALQQRDIKKEQKKWSFFDFPLWKREGMYLIADTIDKDRYGEIFSSLLERGVLISPDPLIPTIIPGEFSDGEIQPLRDILG